MGANQRAQIVMSDDEIVQFVEQSRTCTVATQSPNGSVHLVAMWYAVLDGEIWFETKAKSQKVANLRRNPNITVLIEDGHTYDALRGVSFEGRAEIVEDPAHLDRVGISVWERYNGEYTEALKPLVDQMMHKRIAVRVLTTRTRSWDHRKLGLPAMPLAGSTAAYLQK
ncbi:pyridoxamine 5'-phosphate oxidase family protein [Williamsia sp. CHRR-6]|uniref:pyridoxamine 5'-phosphate oxidase family protein n=1 Tax=Williamsia sp. CHRR-6 TaxID=2835871 RepID=UPI001BDAB0EB|nr:PPOX class F420-dependent oxidoreductase [Williamsia sp. CHRR-6]MBT0565438.1 PPOX class F420-dependent oxidoreductase [Williamsia sp. CHRR-6]